MNRYHSVVSVEFLSNDVFEFVVQRDGLEFTAGDCIAIHDRDEVVSRPYSIASGINDDYLRFVIRRMPDGVVTEYLCQLQPGDTVRIDPPFGWFRPGSARAEGAPFAFIATGTGIAPFLSYLHSVPELPPVLCLWGVRHQRDAIAEDFLRSRCPFQLAVSQEEANGHHRGRVTDLLGMLPLTANIHVYLCGLDAMIDDVSEWLENKGVDFARIHREVFFHASS